MGAPNFGRTNLPSGIIYAFATSDEANKELDLLLLDEAGEGMDEDDRGMQLSIIMHDNYCEAIDYVKELLGLSSYIRNEYIGDRRIIGYVNVTLYNRDSKQWEDGSINIVVENGYHDGARFDIDIEDIRANFPSLNKSQEKLIAREIKRIEKAFARACEIKLVKIAQASNGESFYSQV